MATIREIAQKANVSPATVSRVLKNDSTLSVNPKTRERILTVAEKLNYSIQIPKVGGSEGTVVVTNWYTKKVSMTDLYFRSIRWGVETALKNSGYKVSHNFFNEGLIANDKIVGIIAIGNYLKSDLEELKSVNRPLVIINQDTISDDISCIIPDYINSVNNILEYLLSKGISNIGFISGKDPTAENEDPRRIAYYTYMKKVGLFDSKLIFTGDFSVHSGYTTMQKVIKTLGSDLPKAFFVASDTMAIGAIKALNEAKIAVPERVSIIGFGNTDVGRYLTPSLSTIKISTRQMGEWGVTLLKSIISNQSTIPVKLTIKNELVIRESSI